MDATKDNYINELTQPHKDKYCTHFLIYGLYFFKKCVYDKSF